MGRGHEVSIMWRGQEVRAWLPDPVSHRSIDLKGPVVRATERAAAAVRAMSLGLPTGFESVSRLLLRAEGLASSWVEGVEAPLEQVLLAHAGVGSGTAAHVSDNLEVVEQAITHSRGAQPLSEAQLHAWHRRLMKHGELPDRFVGRWRDELGWIGGATPLQAVFVPAPDEEIAALMADVIDAANTCPWDPVTTAAVVHAQFETIHPYGDGNGRVGRLLILWLLGRHIDDVQVPPPISVLISRDTDSYIAALGAFRAGLDDQLVSWFCDVLENAGNASRTWASQLNDMVDDWDRGTVGLRSDSAGRRIPPILPAHPVISAEIVADELGVSLPAARNGLRTLVDLEILRDLGVFASGPGRPRRWWSAPQLIDLVAGWSL